MAGIWNKLVFIWFCTNIYYGFECSKLNVPRVLLPLFNSFSTNFTLEVTEGGCYKWTSSRIDVVQVNPINVDETLGCSAQAIVSAISKEIARNTAIIFAEEVHSGQMLRCDVIVDEIASLDIVTTTRELYMEEAPEIFEVRAYDDQGNEFTTLDGVEFQWSLININSHQAESKLPSVSVLRFISFRDSPYETPESVDEFERLGKRGNLVLLEGLKTGSAKVSVRLPQQEYRHVPPLEVQLMVIANLIIDPPDVHIMPGDTVNYKILQVQNGRLEEIPLPSAQYYLGMVDEQVGLVDESGHATAIKQGRTKVQLHDRYVDDTSGIKMPSAHFTVALSEALTLSILPHRNWAMLVGEHYEIIVELFDKNNRKLHIGPNIDVWVEFPRKYFHVELSTKNNTHHYGWPLVIGEAPLKATLNAVTTVSGQRQEILPSVSAQETMFIFQKISLHPPEVVLPWDPVVKPRYEVKLKASGGDGSFLWSSSDTTVAMVTQSGLVKTHFHGSVKITASMTRNQHIRADGLVLVLPPSHLEIIEYDIEAELGVPLFLHVAMYGDRPGQDARVPFTQCKDIPLYVKDWNNHFSFNNTLKVNPVGLACTTLAIVGHTVGTSKITVAYSREDGLKMEDTVTVGTYRPLQALHPESGQTVLSVGSSRMVAFVGGPRPWLDRPSEHVRKIEVVGEEEDELEVTELVDKATDKQDTYVYQVMCRAIGEFQVVIKVYNLPSRTHCHASESQASVTVLCAKPRYLSLHSQLEVSDPELCPMKLNAEKIVAQNYKDIPITVIVKDFHGRTFDNISSLYLDWKLSHPSLANVLVKNSVIAVNHYEGDILLPGRNYNIIKPNGRTGVLEVNLLITGYNMSVLQSNRVTPESPVFGTLDNNGFEYTPEIKASLSIILVNDTAITPKHTVVFNHPKNIVTLQVSQGSGHYDFVVSSEEIATLRYVEGKRVIEVTPINDGMLKLALVDLCLPSKPAQATVQVLGLGSLQVDMPDRVERGSCVRATVTLYDTMDNILPVPNPAFLDLHAIPDSNIIAVKLDTADLHGKTHPDNELHYVVTGMELGETTLTFVSRRWQEKIEVSSQPIHIQVFPALRLFPRNLTLIVGSSFQVTSRGGPQPDANIEYSIGSGSIASIESNGIVEALDHGSTTITGRAVGINKETGQNIIYSQDTVEVQVVPLRGIKIHAPLTRVLKSFTMPVHAAGIPDHISPLILGSVNSGITYSWRVVPKDVAIVHSVFHHLGLKVTAADQLSMQLTAVKSGHATLFLNATITTTVAGSSEPATSVLYQDSLEILVFDDIQLVRPPHMVNLKPTKLILAPNTQVQLQTNREGAAKVVYSLRNQAHTPSTVPDKNLTALGSPTSFVTVDESGLVTSNNMLGRSVIMITAFEEFNIKQSISVCVIVKQIHYLMINVRAKVRISDNEDITKLPKGLQLELYVTYHDNTGIPFTATTSELKIRTNRFDLSHVRRGADNTTVLVDLLHRGTTLLKLWDEMTPHHTGDYMKLPVGEVIFPVQDHLVVNELVCFSSPLVTLDNQHGTWDSDNPTILPLDPMLGYGKARMPGTATVYLLLAGSRVGGVEIQVLPIHAIVFLSVSNVRTLTNARPDLFYDVPFVFTSTRSPNDKSSNHIGQIGSCYQDIHMETYPFICDLRFDSPVANLDVLDIFAVHQGFNVTTGNYFCRIVPSGHISLEKSVMSTNFSLYVINSNVISPSFTIPFLPAFFLHAQEVYLSDTQVVGTVRISGHVDVLAQIQVKPEDERLLTVGSLDKESPTSIVFQVLLKEYYWSLGELSTKLNLIITSELTSQRVELPVKVRLAGETFAGTCMMSRFVTWGELLYYYRYTIFLVLTTLAVMAGTLYVYSSYIRPLRQVSPDIALQSPQESIFMNTSCSPGRLMSLRSPFAEGDPVYGDPRLYQTSPNIQRSRRFL